MAENWSRFLVRLRYLLAIHVSLLTVVHSGDLNAPKATPKVAVIGGVKFHRSKNGNMYRQAIIRAQRYVAHPGHAQMLTDVPFRRSAAVNKVNVPCRNFSNTGISLRNPASLH